jgi:polysaccharide biosynthesis protein VpsQ
MFGLKIRRAKIALAGFVGFLTLLVLLADSGRGRTVFGLVHSVPGGDKAGHFLLFGILSFLVNLLMRGAEARVLGRPFFKSSVTLMSIVTLEECSQVFFRSRTFDLVDLGADALGIYLFAWLAMRYLDWKRVRLAAAGA